MKISENLINELRSLEESLWIESTRFDLAYMENILHKDFFEFGRSGSVYTRKSCLEIPACEIKAKLPLDNFLVHYLSENCIMVTYITKDQLNNYKVVNRSSIWIKSEDGWKLRFHQGTTVLDVS
ncbi:MAG: DUF4440 domain-containing protein [Calditrichaeota bacterium]|nr:MAG: DUF4440 domain-containing protein [Calditrichota bacterium]